jgi:hypothetical protein
MIIGRDWDTIANTLEMLDVGRYRIGRKVIHTLIKARMKSNFDTLGGNVIPEKVLSSMGKVTKKDALASIVDELALAFTGWSNPNATSKGTKASEVFFLAGMEVFKGREVLATGRIGVLSPKVVMKGIRPEFRREVGTSEKRVKALPNRLIGTLDRSVLVRSVGTGRENLIAKRTEEFTNAGIAVELTTLIQVDVLVLYIRRATTEPRVKPIDRSSF